MANWIQGAIKHKGLFSAEAHAAGMSTGQYALKKAHAKGKVGQRARLALTLGRLRKAK